ncbi:MAG TPA: VWA domain-containing protein [bacterium]|nr:VWA domain-containing protein [bacterium]
MEIGNLKTAGPLPAALANPAAIEKVARKRVSAPAPAIRARLIPPLHVQLGRKHLDSIRDEIASAEDVLLNVYEDIEMFDARASALDDIAFLLMRMKDRLDDVVSGRDRRADIRAGMNALAEGLERAAESAKRRNIPLLKPVSRVASPPESAPAVLADIVFVVSRSTSMKTDAEAMLRGMNAFSSDLANRGISAMFGAQPFERSSQPAGPLRSSIFDISDDLRSIFFNGETANALAAVRQTLEDQSFRENSLKAIVVVSDRDADDDYASAGEEALEAVSNAGAVVFAIAGKDFFSNRPFSALNRLVEGSGGEYLSINKASFADNFAALAERIAEALLSRGAHVTETSERIVHIGPAPADSFLVQFPDYRPDALGLRNLPLETEEDFAAALEKISDAIAALAEDKTEKGALLERLRRILQFFDGIRAFRLDFRA